MKFKFYEPMGTLCERCNHGTVFQRRANARIHAHCDQLGGRAEVPTDISQCTAFEDKSLPRIYQLERIAWDIKHDKGGRMIGFKPPKTTANRYIPED
jgi:hypothetical protein